MLTLYNYEHMPTTFDTNISKLYEKGTVITAKR